MTTTDSSGETGRCSRCNGNGYLPESTLSVPVHCSCSVGVLARSMDGDPLDNRKAVLFDRARRAAHTGGDVR